MIQNRFYNSKAMLAVALTLFISACSERELILPGEREDIRELVKPEVTEAQKALQLPAMQQNTDWTHKNGGPSHAAGHVALSTAPRLLWSASIGQGNATKLRLSADPVVLNGRIFTQDAVAEVRAFDTNGQMLWSVNLTPASDTVGQASGGGLAAAGNAVYATTGFGEVVALAADSGEIFWRHKMGGAISAAPVVIGNQVIVVARNNIAQGLSLDHGRILWEQRSAGEDPGTVGGGTPAAVSRMAILPFTNGELAAALTLNGQRVWSAAVTGTRVGLARSGVADVSGDPVITGGRVYAANQSGRLVAVERKSGDLLWTALDGSYSPVLPVGNSVFMISDESKLKRLSAANGGEIWSVELPEFVPLRWKRRGPLAAFVYFGPVLAGGRLLVAGSDGLMRSYDPATGAELSGFEIPGGAASHIAIAGGRLYVLSTDGELHAYQ